ncbi:Brix-domain-containing protein [Biscogniauxia mediterranea]|nr:Brix-domain-containing protein [Biscogniauxia mediterranea]
MGAQKPGRSSSGASLSKKTGNKLHRQSLYVDQKRSREKEKREARFRRKKEEDRDPELRRARIERNQPTSIDKKRVWDDVDDDSSLGASVDLIELRKRRRIQQEEEEQKALEAEDGEEEEDGQDEEDSMLGSDDEEDSDEEAAAKARARQVMRDDSQAPSVASTATIDLTPDSLVAKFPSLFSDDRPPEPKVLITTCLNATIHDQAQLFCNLFPNSTYIKRSAHKYAHKYSVREIASYAANREYTTLVILNEDQKRISGMDIVNLPSGPTFHFSISNFVPGKRLPGHGNATNHYPELLLNGFKTPLGVLTAALLQTLWPKTPEFEGRQVVTFHNQRDYIFVRRHRYIFRDKRASEKSAVGADGKELKGVEGIRTGLQELGPRFTLKLRRVEKGIGRAGSEGPSEWEWKAKMEKKRTRFNL